MTISNQDYKLLDFIRVPFQVSPIMILLMVAEKIIASVIPSIQIIIIANFIDTAIGIFNGNMEADSIVMPLVLILLLQSYKYIVGILKGLLVTKLCNKLTETYRVAITEKRARLEYKHVENNETWDLIERVGNDPSNNLYGGLDILLSMVGIIVQIFSTLFVIMSQIWWVGLMLITFSIPLLCLAVKSGKVNYQASQEAAKYTRRSEYMKSVLTSRDNVEERTLFGYFDEINKQYLDKFTSAYHINYKTQRDRFIKMKSASLITVVISIVIASVLISPLGSGSISIGLFMVLVTSTFDLAQLMSWRLTHITSQLANNREYFRDLSIFSKLSEVANVTELPSENISKPECVEFRNVSFAYPGTNRMILKNLNLKLYAKKCYAIVGANGAGKTTITKLLTGLYDNYTGDILVDGVNLHTFTQSEKKALFSVVYQDYAKYQICMRDSIGLGNVNGASDKDIMDAIEVLGLGKTVKKLPSGLDTPIGKMMKGGIDLSGGEWQRVAIARTLVNYAPMYLLDEPTAALDPVAESELYAMFGKVCKGKTTVLITHRLGAAKLADEIIVIANGCVAELGSHDTLMKLGGIYSEMFEAQKGWYE